MNKSLIVSALTTALLTSAAYAQAPATPPTPATPPAAATTPPAATTTFTLAAADVTKLKDWITAQKTASVAAPAGLTVAVGTTLPATVTLYPIPASAGVTAVGTNQYAVVADKIVLVNPADRKIVYVFA
jgi:hypothetical protein